MLKAMISDGNGQFFLQNYYLEIGIISLSSFSRRAGNWTKKCPDSLSFKPEKIEVKNKFDFDCHKFQTGLLGFCSRSRFVAAGNRLRTHSGDWL